MWIVYSKWVSRSALAVLIVWFTWPRKPK